MADTIIKGIEQGRAKFAYSCAEAGAKLSETKKKEYKSYIKKLPTLIKTNGLGAALAFAKAKGSNKEEPDKNKAWGLIYCQIEEWIKKDDKNLISFEENQLLKILVETDSYTYRAITVEIMAFLTWLRRFAEGLIEGDSENT